MTKNTIKPQRSRFDASPRHVLIAEDNTTNQLVLKTMVQRLGYEVTIVDNGKQAVDWLDAHKADIVLMDCQMPVMDGLQATRMIRVKPHPVCDIPIVAVTANVLSGDRDLCLEAGMNDYIKKPVSKAVIEEKLHHWLGTEFN
jgi:CheY-like chemotaxis protein